MTVTFDPGGNGARSARVNALVKVHVADAVNDQVNADVKVNARGCVDQTI